MATIKTSKWDVAEFLDTEEKVFAYIEAAFEEGDASLVAAALGDIARARGMTHIAKTAGVSRESLYRALSADGNPEFGTIMKVMKAMGLQLSIEPAPGQPEECESA